jgi:hypothetical protein
MGFGRGRWSVKAGVTPGRATGSDFWQASEDGELRVIGDEPAITDYDWRPSGEVPHGPRCHR